MTTKKTVYDHYAEMLAEQLDADHQDFMEHLAIPAYTLNNLQKG
jgi:hypothetical protein